MGPVSTKTRLRVLLVLLFTIFFVIPITPAMAIFIDFETYPAGDLTLSFDQIDTQFSSWGISHMKSEDLSGNIALPVIGQLIDYQVRFHSGISALAPHPGATKGPDPKIPYLYGFAQAPIVIYFTSPIKYFSVYALDVGYNGLIVNAYDVGFSLIDSIMIDGTGRNHDGQPGGDGFDFIEFINPGISAISFSQIHDAQWDRDNGLGLEGYLLDDMTFYPVTKAMPWIPLLLLDD